MLQDVPVRPLKMAVAIQGNSIHRVLDSSDIPAAMKGLIEKCMHDSARHEKTQPKSHLAYRGRDVVPHDVSARWDESHQNSVVLASALPLRKIGETGKDYRIVRGPLWVFS